MNERYKILHSEKDLYLENSPVIIRAIALVQDTLQGKLHTQVKYESVAKEKIVQLKAKIVEMDAIGRALEVQEKIYVDVNAVEGALFGQKVAVPLRNNTARKIAVSVTEVCFASGKVWTNSVDVWSVIPKQKAISTALQGDAFEEFKAAVCKEAKYLPLRHQGIWFCSCGTANSGVRERCHACGASLQTMETVDKEILRKNGIYRKAKMLTTDKKSTSKKIEEGIGLFEKISDWQDASKQVGVAKIRLTEVKKAEEKAAKERAEAAVRAQKKKKKTIIFSSIAAAVLVVIIVVVNIINSVVRADKYEQAQAYYAQGQYQEAMDLFAELGEYEDSARQYWRAKQYVGKEYGELVKGDHLTEFIVPETATEIPAEAFKDCDGLTSVVIPDSVKSIGNAAFENCSSLTSVTIPDSVTSIGNSAFLGCDSLTSVTIGNGVTSIGSSAFKGCSSLTSVTIGNSVTSIGNSAFYKCDSLTSVTIGNSVTSIGTIAFYSCDGLTSIYITDIAAWCNISFSASANPLCNGAKLYVNNKLVTNLIIPNTVTEIKADAFSGCSSLTGVVIPDSVTSIGYSAFSGCSSLTSVVIPDSVTSIGSSAFSGCSSLTSVTIPDSVTSIGYSAFSGCSSLTSVTIPDSVTSIGDFAFYRCSSLTSVTIPDSVTSIGNNAFAYCNSLTSVIFKNPNGWWLSTSSTATSGTSGTSISSTSLSDSSTAAKYLKSTYRYYYWKRS